jgi:exodeoxyribonuclease VII large subunit
MHRIAQLETRMHTALQRSLTEQKHRLQLMEKVIEGASPMQILQRGYSITRCDGRVVHNMADLPKDAVLTTTLADGEVKSVVIVG